MIRLAALAGFLLGAAALVPLRVALPAGLSATRASGTIWNGHLEGAAWRGVMLGTLDVGLRPLALLTGEARLALSGPDLMGDVIIGEGVETLSGARALNGLPMAGVITGIAASSLSLRFEDGQCVAASGSLSATRPGSAAPLAGTPRCTGSSASITLASPDGLSTMALAITASGDVRFTS